jgi:hypothetical protein
MALHALNKGKRAEREVISILQPVVTQLYRAAHITPPTLQRNTIQSDDGGCDLVGLDWLALEVKHQETFHLNEWWVQTVTQAYRGGKRRVPVLWYKRNNVQWRVRMPGGCGAEHDNVWSQAVVDISYLAFMDYFNARLTHELLNLTPTQ